MKWNNSNTFSFCSKLVKDKIIGLNSRIIVPEEYLQISDKSLNEIKPKFNYFFNTNNKDSIKLRHTNLYKNEQLKNILQQSPFSSFFSMTIDFNRDDALKNDWEFLDSGNIRIGKLLELLDIFSAMTVFKHINLERENVTTVTASVSPIKFFEKISINKPLTINSYLTSVGNSSVENRIDLFNDSLNSDLGFIGSAYFTFVAREPKNYNRSMKIPKLNLDIEKGLEIIFNKNDNLLKSQVKNLISRNEEGMKKKYIIKKESEDNLSKTMPTTSECELLHNIYLNKIDKKRKISLRDTKAEKISLMYNQHMNYNGHIFGGYIMRESIEISYACVKLFDPSNKYDLIGIGNVTFIKPVLKDSLSKFKALVTYRKGKFIHVLVNVYNFVGNDVIEDTSNLTTSMSLFYSEREDKLESEICDVYPISYECGIMYLEGKRKLEKYFN